MLRNYEHQQLGDPRSDTVVPLRGDVTTDFKEETMTTTTLQTRPVKESSIQFDLEDVVETRARLSILLTFLDGNSIPGHTEIEHQIENLYANILVTDCRGWIRVRSNPPFLQHATREQTEGIGRYFTGTPTIATKERFSRHKSLMRIATRYRVKAAALALLTDPTKWGKWTKKIALELSEIPDEELFKRTPRVGYSTTRTHTPGPVKPLKQQIVEQRRRIVRKLDPNGTLGTIVNSKKWGEVVIKLANGCGIDPMKFGEWVKAENDLPEIEKALRTFGNSLEPEVRIGQLLTLTPKVPAK